MIGPAPLTCTATLSATTTRTSALLLHGSRCSPATLPRQAQLPFLGAASLLLLLLLSLGSKQQMIT